eukprot:GEMP01005089.1.p1 GENE.GEMP01005089.1~~GEMP01005089.1.p1  ORF type:complete len:820 (+),score=224.17 GEMP01005089.1:133-2592(+)
MVFDAPSSVSYDIKNAAEAWEEVLRTPLELFSYVIFTFPENLFAKTLDVHTSTKGGMTEMLQTIEDLTTTSSTPCWGGFKLHVVNADVSVRTAKFIGFQYVPAKAKINAKRVAKEVNPCVEELLSKGNLFLEADRLDQISDSIANCKIIAERLELPEDHSLQFHAVNVEAVATAWQKALTTELDYFSYVLCSVEKDVPYREVVAQSSKQGGLTEMLKEIKALAPQGPVWGAFKVHALGAKASDPVVQYIGFQYAPLETQASAERVIVELRPHVIGAFTQVKTFINVEAVEELPNVDMLSKALQLDASYTLQLHTVLNMKEAEAAFQEVFNSDLDHFAYAIVTAEEDELGKKTLTVQRSTEGGASEMVAALQKVQGSCYGAFKVQLVSETCERVTKHVAFQYTAPGADPISSEVKPFVTGVFHKADIFIETDTIEKLTERDYLMTELKVHPELTLQFRAVESQNAAAAWNEVLNTEVDDFAYAIFSLSDAHKYVEVLDVQKSTEGGITELVEKIKALSAEGRSVWGGFKVQSVDDRSLLRKKPKRAKFVGFQYMSDEAKTDVLEVIPFACSALDKFNLDMFIETADIADLENIEAIANHLKLNDEWTLYEFGGPVRCRTEIMMDLDSMGKHKLEVAQALDAWDKVLSNNDEETYCIFALSNDRTKLNVVIHGSGPGHKACEAATDAMLNQNRPVWGCFRLQGKNEKADKASCRTKYIGFQVIPPATKPLVRSTVNLVKPLVMRTLKQAIVWVEAESKECLTESVIIQKLGNDNTNEYDFGEALGAEAEKTIKECVESHFSIVEAKVAAPSEEKEETATPA